MTHTYYVLERLTNGHWSPLVRSDSLRSIRKDLLVAGTGNRDSLRIVKVTESTTQTREVVQ